MFATKEGVVHNVLPLRKDPKASPRQLAAARRYVLGVDGPGIVRSARRLGISAGYLSELLRGTRSRCLRLSELHRLRTGESKEGGGPAAQALPDTSPQRTFLPRRREEVAI